MAHCSGPLLTATRAVFGVAQPSGITLGWDAVTNAPIAGYRLYWGIAPHTYTQVVQAGPSPSATVSGLSNGVTYYFAVTAYNTNGVESGFSSEISITSGGTNLPVITLTSPTNNSVFTEPADISLAANVSSNAHVIDKVQFYLGTTLLGQRTAPPYTLTWSNVVAGNYNILAQATYDGSKTVDSGTASVIVASLRPGGGAVLQLRMTTDGRAQISGTGQAAASYEVLASDDLRTWIVLGSATADGGGHFSFTDSSFSRRFYRARETAR